MGGSGAGRLAVLDAAPGVKVLMLSVHPSRLADLLTPQTMSIDPPVKAREYRDIHGNICTDVARRRHRGGTARPALRHEGSDRARPRRQQRRSRLPPPGMKLAGMNEPG